MQWFSGLLAKIFLFCILSNDDMKQYSMERGKNANSRLTLKDFPNCGFGARRDNSCAANMGYIL